MITVVDGPEGRLAEAAVRDALFQNSPDILFIASTALVAGAPCLVFETVSPALFALTGLRPDDLVGRSPQDSLPPELADPIIAGHHECIAHRSRVTFAAEHVSVLGARVFEGTLAPVSGPATGEVIKLVGALRDVTERNRQEAAFRHGERMIAIGHLAAGVAHDFNNVLQSIGGSIELVLEQASPGTRAHEYLAIGLRSARRGSTLTHHLLSYARKQKFSPRIVALRDMLSDIGKLLALSIGPHIAVRLIIDPRAPVVLVDPGQLETALLNLAINAGHAMPVSGSLVIETRAVVRSGGDFVSITVTDTGAGMDVSTLSKAGEAFFTTKGRDGTGLGLSMVRSFAAKSGGSFTITSAIGAGTSASIILPAAIGVAIDDTQTPGLRPAPGTHVLVVDDDADVLITTGAFLEHAGFTILRASGGRQALAVLASTPEISVLVTDQAMPGLSGRDLIVQARSLRPGLPAILMTGFSEPRHGGPVVAGLTMLHKPFQRHQLLTSLKHLLAPEKAISPNPV